MKHLFVMDPLERIQVGGDSTYVTMRECTDRGFEVAMCTPDRLFSHDGEARATVTPVRTTADAPYFHTGTPHESALEAFDVVWMRKDPPFDMTYIFSTYLLDMAGTKVVNHPAGLKLFNEKLWVQARWPQFQPETLITNDIKRIRTFVEDAGGRIVLKPWDGNGGRGVLVTEKGDANLSSMIELLTREGRDYLIAQRYLPGVMHGDKRVLLFAGEVVGAMARVPVATDHRANMHVGARVHRCELTERDREICAAIGPALREHGQLFVGIDLIDGHLTEINVTSPTGIQEINRLYGLKLQADLVDAVIAHTGGHA
ncbi:MAG: glutathione synthase [Alphaproteobacteria bacterium]|nr:glutathione synthase [Alphaproteobacteria bacterium]MCB9693813.1 glutathione synthase [Alphaproteobacteria bacterium]